MKKRYYPIPFFCLVVFSACFPQKNTPSSLSEKDAEKLFAYEVYPLLETKCFACHGDDPEEIEGEFDMQSLATLLEGGESGHAALVPGEPAKSPIYVAATRVDEDFSMPPKENDKLSPKQLDILYQWIAAKAPWPDKDRRQELLDADDWDFGGMMKVVTSTARSETWARRRYKPKDLWAFSPLIKPEIPQKYLSGTKNPIDAFIDRKLEEKEIKASKKADRLTLIRRATFDLIGLPPSPEEVEAFLADNRSNAYEKLVDRLLASPQYGEQWARHWLDVVRYADTDGFSNDYARPNAWRYRDYVIRSFNQDKPYNTFVHEQIAGDEIDSNDPENLIAVGFLRMGPWEHTGMSVAAETRQYFLDDVTNSVGETFLSQPLRCARCHDHKFDPIPTKDFYQIQAVFATTQFAKRKASFLPEENLKGMEDEREQIERWLEEAISERKTIDKKEEAFARQWYKERGLRFVPKKKRSNLPQHSKPPRYLGLTDQELGLRKLLDKRKQTLLREVARYEPMAFSVYNGPNRLVHSGRDIVMPASLQGEPDSTFILTGGNVYAQEEWVRPGILSALHAWDTKGFEPEVGKIPNDMERRRLALAHWITHPKNPLTARSIVNRVWQYHFGKGIAENSNNFGATGKKPSHPDLLDWLAMNFMENGWSIKKLHKLIMMSEVYQRSGKHKNPQKLAKIDPDNQFLAVFNPRRLDAEEIRDAMLCVSGELNPEMGGIPIRPEINMEVALQPRHTMGSIKRAYQPSPKPGARNRRTIYTEKYRSFSDPLLEVFNKPPSDLSCERRTSSSVTPQVFSLLNSTNSRDRAIAFGDRMRKIGESLETQVIAGFRWAWSREASKKEIKEAMAFIEKMIVFHQENPPSKETYPTEIKREMFEEMTGEPFEYVEKLDVYKNYTPDLKPWDVDAKTRALADFALVLFNSNEFVYVY